MSERSKTLSLPMTEAQFNAVQRYCKRWDITDAKLANRLCWSLFGKKKTS